MPNPTSGRPETTKEIVAFIMTMQTVEDVEIAKQMTSYRLNIPEFRNALYARLVDLLTSQPVAEAMPTHCIRQGDQVYDLGEWVTLKEYVLRHEGITSTNIVSNWISRGVVPPDCVVELPDLNSLKLIRDQVYHRDK